MTLPETCPKCGAAKSWRGPRFRGSVGWLAPEHLDKCPTVATLADGRELIVRADVDKMFSTLHQRLEYECKTCEFMIQTPTLS